MNDRLHKALVAAAEKLKGRPLSSDERSRLIGTYEAAQGSAFDKSVAALSKTASVTEQHVRAKASDNTDRIMQELVQAVGQK